MFESYVYLVRNKITQEFYYGSRYKNRDLGRLPEDDLWVYYFTSSKSVKLLIESHGKESFEYVVIFRSNNYDECYWFEQDKIRENISNPLCLNRSYIDRIHGVKFSTAGLKSSQATREKLSASKSDITDETRKRMSLAKKGKSTGPFTEDRKRNLSKSKTGKRLSAQHRESISLSKLGEKNPNFGKERSEETKRKMSEWQQANKEARATESKARWQDPVYRQMMLDARKKNK